MNPKLFSHQQCMNVGSGSRKRRYQDRQSSRFSVQSIRLTPIVALLLLLKSDSVMGKCHVASLSCHSTAAVASAAFLPAQSRLQSHHHHQHQATTAIPAADVPSLNDDKDYKSRATFVGDSTTTLELDAPMELVQEFLQSDSSNAYLLGTDDISCQEDFFECKQPILEFMGLKLQPIFRHKLYRKPNQVTASIEEGSKAEIVEHSKHPAKRVISSLVHDATFVGESVVTVHPSHEQHSEEARLCSYGGDTQRCKLSIALSLTLQIPMPRFIPIPPGFNALGSAIVRRTGRIRTKQLLERLKEAYYQHQLQLQLQQLQEEANNRADAPRNSPTVPSFEDNFRKMLESAIITIR